MDGIVALAPSFDTCGWLARDGATLERVRDVLLPVDSTPLPQRIVTIAELWALALDPVQRVARSCLDASVDAEPTSDRFFRGRDDTETFRVLQGVQVREQFGAWIREVRPTFGPDIGDRLRSLDELSIEDVARQVARQQEIRDHLTRSTMEAVIAIPTTGGPAPHRRTPPDQMARVRPSILRLTCLAPLAGLPQVTVPAGRVDGGPIGLSMIGPPGSDRALLRLAGTIAP
jgi:amidase